MCQLCKALTSQHYISQYQHKHALLRHSCLSLNDQGLGQLYCTNVSIISGGRQSIVNKQQKIDSDIDVGWSSLQYQVLSNLQRARDVNVTRQCRMNK